MRILVEDCFAEKKDDLLGLLPFFIFFHFSLSNVLFFYLQSLIWWIFLKPCQGQMRSVNLGWRRKKNRTKVIIGNRTLDCSWRKDLDPWCTKQCIC